MVQILLWEKIFELFIGSFTRTIADFLVDFLVDFLLDFACFYLALQNALAIRSMGLLDFNYEF